MTRAIAATLVLVAAAAVSAAVTVRGIAGTPVAVPAPPEPPADYRHVIAPGETLMRISQEYYGSASRWKEIAAANGITDASKLAVGKALVIPGYAPAPPEGMDRPVEPLRLLSPVRDAFPWPVLVRAAVAYALSTAVLAAAVLAWAAARPGSSPAGLARAAAMMAASSAAFGSVVVLGASVATVRAEAFATSGALSAAWWAATTAAGLGAVWIVLRQSRPHEGPGGPVAATAMRFAVMLAAAAAAGGLLLAASGVLSAAAAYAAGL